MSGIGPLLTSKLVLPSSAFFSEGNLLGAVPCGHILCTSVYEGILKWRWQQRIEVHGGHWLDVLPFFLVEIFSFLLRTQAIPTNLQSPVLAGLLDLPFHSLISHRIFSEIFKKLFSGCFLPQKVILLPLYREVKTNFNMHFLSFSPFGSH